MMKSIVVGAIVGLLAVAAHVLKKRTPDLLAQKSAEIRRWEDDGGRLPPPAVDNN
jgi:hypothetical protein